MCSTPCAPKNTFDVSDYKSRVIKLQILPLIAMIPIEFNDITFLSVTVILGMLIYEGFGFLSAWR